MYYKIFKRPFDFAVSLVLLIFFFIPIILTAILIRIDSPGPIFFKQTRVGKDLNLFQVLKFRTMSNEKREVGITPIIGKTEGITNLGYFLRRFKIDEIPQLINVLKGNMSLIGPRPSVPQQLEQMTGSEKERYSVRPGMTGLAQVNGNIYLTWKDRYKYDLEYVNKIYFITDLKILFRTLAIVINGEGNYINKSKRSIK